MKTSLWCVSTFAVAAFLLGAAIQRVVETFARRQLVPGEKKMQWSFHAFFWLHSIIMLGSLGEYLAFRRHLDWRWSGVGLVAYLGSVILRNVAIRTLGRFWSLHIEIRSQHQMIREGVYNYVRHPAYSAIVLEVLAIPLTVNAWWMLLFAAVTYIPVLLLRLKTEERALVEKFGDQYQRYQGEVGALVPRWTQLRQLVFGRPQDRS